MCHICPVDQSLGQHTAGGEGEGKCGEVGCEGVEGVGGEGEGGEGGWLH